MPLVIYRKLKLDNRPESDDESSSDEESSDEESSDEDTVESLQKFPAAILKEKTQSVAASVQKGKRKVIYPCPRRILSKFKYMKETIKPGTINSIIADRSTDMILDRDTNKISRLPRRVFVAQRFAAKALYHVSSCHERLVEKRLSFVPVEGEKHRSDNGMRVLYSVKRKKRKHKHGYFDRFYLMISVKKMEDYVKKMAEANNKQMDVPGQYSFVKGTHFCKGKTETRIRCGNELWQYWTMEVLEGNS